MQALPMITPSVVKNARILFAQRASSATIQVSLRSIMIVVVDYSKPMMKKTGGTLDSPFTGPFQLPPCIARTSIWHHLGDAGSGVFRGGLFLLHSLPGVFHGFVVRIKSQGSA